jgi:two-component system CheB/CheR fusion protein
MGSEKRPNRRPKKSRGMKSARPAKRAPEPVESEQPVTRNQLLIVGIGASETIGGFTDLFEPVDKNSKIYSKKAAQTPTFQLPIRKEPGERLGADQPRHSAMSFQREMSQGEPEGFRAELSSQREADRVTIGKYSPPDVLMDSELQILQFRGPTSAYLEPPTGKATFDVLKMARQGLTLPLRAAMASRRPLCSTSSRREGTLMAESIGTAREAVEAMVVRKGRCRAS